MTNTAATVPTVTTTRGAREILPSDHLTAPTHAGEMLVNTNTEPATVATVATVANVALVKIGTGRSYRTAWVARFVGTEYHVELNGYRHVDAEVAA